MTRGPELERKVLSAVGEVMYREGINATGVDRLSEVAGVSKRTLYQRFHSRDELIGGSLAASDERVADVLLRSGEETRSAGAGGAIAIRTVFHDLRHRLASEGFRGCPFINAAIELADREHPAHQAIRIHKERVRAWFEDTACADGLAAPASLSRQLMVVLDGFFVECLLRPDEEFADDTLNVVDALLAAAKRPSSAARRPMRAERRRRT